MKAKFMPEFSLIGWLGAELASVSSAVNSLWQLLTTDDNCYEKKLNGIFIYTIQPIFVPNLSSLGWFWALLEFYVIIPLDWLIGGWVSN